MRAWFRDLPIQRKLALITLTSTALALVLGVGGFFTWDILLDRREAAQDLITQARIVSENSTASLTFGDPTTAGETLATLELQPYIESACMYSADGQLFATYHRDGQRACPPLPADAFEIRWQSIRIVRSIMLEDRRLGTLLIERNLQDIRNHVLIGASILAALFVGSMFVAAFVGSRMQQTIAEPLLALADTARAVSVTDDYTGRARVTTQDELGVVVRAFNDMLDRVQARTAELSNANRLKDEFLATLSHELRTPLNAMLGWLTILDGPDVPPATQARGLDSIKRNARLQARLIGDLLEVSRIISGKLHLQMKRTDLAAIVDSAVDVVQPAVTAKNIRLTTEVATRPAFTLGDPDRLQQVVWNLLSNAVRFTPSDGAVTVRLTRSHEYVLTVSDTGVGIEPAFLPHVFQPFRQADASPSREHGGLGLGLAIVRQLVELHGGTVAARSDGRGRGATFEVRLPSVLPMDAPLATAPSRRQTLEASHDLLAGINVLVVEDDQDARDLLEISFAGFGAHVITAASAAEALQTIDRAVPAVIVSDIGMPGEDGYSLMRRIRSRPAQAGGQVPAVALTAYASPADEQAAIAAGYQAHVAKPFDPASLAKLVLKLVTH